MDHLHFGTMLEGCQRILETVLRQPTEGADNVAPELNLHLSLLAFHVVTQLS